jgi:hypothetical protein
MADPWRDTAVIDARAPRFNQAVAAVVALLGAILGLSSAAAASPASPTSAAAATARRGRARGLAAARDWERRLAAEPESLLRIDVRERLAA